MKSKKVKGETPAGGVSSEIFFLDDGGDLVEESVATRANILEYDAKGNIIRTTYAILKPHTRTGESSQ